MFAGEETDSKIDECSSRVIGTTSRRTWLSNPGLLPSDVIKNILDNLPAYAWKYLAETNIAWKEHVLHVAFARYIVGDKPAPQSIDDLFNSLSKYLKCEQGIVQAIKAKIKMLGGSILIKQFPMPEFLERELKNITPRVLSMLPSFELPDSYVADAETYENAREILSSCTYWQDPDLSDSDLIEPFRLAIEKLTLPEKIISFSEIPESHLIPDKKYVVISADDFYCGPIDNISQGNRGITWIIDFDNKNTIRDSFGIVCEHVQSVIIKGSNLTVVDNNFFYGCHSLINIKIPSTINWVGYLFLHNCKNLRRLALPRLIVICGGFLSGCSKLTFLELLSSQEITGDGFLSMCTGLTALTLPNNIKRIGKNFLYKCSGLTLGSVTVTEGSLTAITLADRQFDEIRHLFKLVPEVDAVVLSEAGASMAVGSAC